MRIWSVWVFLFFSLGQIAVAEKPFIVFDVPAIGAARELLPEPSLNDPNLRIIEIVIPISTRLIDPKKQTIEEFRFEVSWNRNIYPMVDYGPKTLTDSRIEGLVSIEKNKQRTGSLGLNINGRLNELVGGSVQGKLENSNGSVIRYQELPQQDIVVASGSIQRGTGAFFRFHPSPVSTLEGGRDLVVAYQVPASWRGGVLRIECVAKGNRKLFVGFTEPISSSRSFVMPVYLQGDSIAYDAATEFVRTEQQFRRSWRRAAIDRRSPNKLLSRIDVASLIQSSSTRELESIQSRLPSDVRATSELFLDAKRQLSTLGR